MSIITDPMATVLNTSISLAEAHSALPWSPVVAEAPRETRHLRQVRSVLADALDALARRVQPYDAPCTLAPGR